MQYRPLGKNGPEVSVLSFGAWQLGDMQYWGHHDEGEAERAVMVAVDAGITLFDTAEMYGQGQSEIELGKALGRHRDEVLIATKVLPDHCAPVKVKKACENSLRRLHTDWIDLYQVHWPSRDVPFEETWSALAELRKEGKVRWVGVSNFGPQDLDAWMAAGEAVSNQVGYNLLFRAVEYDVAPACERHGVGMMAYMPLLQGLLAGKYERVEEIPRARRRTRHFRGDREGVQHSGPGHEDLLGEVMARFLAQARDVDLSPAQLALAWLLAQPGVTTAVVGGRKPAQVDRNLAAADAAVPRDTLERLDEISAPLKEAMGPNPDMWKEGDEARIR